MYQIPTFPLVGLAALVGGYFWGRGRTGDVVLSESESQKAFEDLCASIPKDSPITAKQLAELAGESIAPDMHWPPRFFATKAHKAAWGFLLSWAQAKAELAAAESRQLCDVILQGSNPLQVNFKKAQFNPTIPGGSAPTKVGGLSGGPSNIATAPTPGRWSKQVPNLGLLGNTGQAYGLPSGSARLAASKAVNNHPLNRAWAKYVPTGGNNFNEQHYAPAILSFDNVQPIYYPPAEEIGL